MEKQRDFDLNFLSDLHKEYSIDGILNRYVENFYWLNYRFRFVSPERFREVVDVILKLYTGKSISQIQKDYENYWDNEAVHDTPPEERSLSELIESDLQNLERLEKLTKSLVNLDLQQKELAGVKLFHWKYMYRAYQKTVEHFEDKNLIRASFAQQTNFLLSGISTFLPAQIDLEACFHQIGVKLTKVDIDLSTISDENLNVRVPKGGIEEIRAKLGMLSNKKSARVLYRYLRRKGIRFIADKGRDTKTNNNRDFAEIYLALANGNHQGIDSALRNFGDINEADAESIKTELIDLATHLGIQTLQPPQLSSITNYITNSFETEERLNSKQLIACDEIIDNFFQ